MSVATTAGMLADALGFVAQAVPRRATIPIVEHVALVAHGGGLTISGTDFDIALSAAIEVDSTEAMAVTVPYARLAGLAAALPTTAMVTFTPTGDALAVASGRGRWRLPTLPAADFPALYPPGAAAVSFTLDQDEVRRVVKRVAFAMEDDPARFYLCGVYLTAVGDMSCWVATDGYRLAMTTTAGTAAVQGVIIPAPVIELLPKLDGELAFKVDTSKIEIAGGGRRLLSKLVCGTFPDYARVIPAESNNKLTVCRDELAAAAGRLLAVGGAKRPVQLSWADGTAQLAHNQGEEEIEPISLFGSGKVALAADYLIEQIAALAGKHIMLDAAGHDSPVRIMRPDEAGTTTVLASITGFP